MLLELPAEVVALDRDKGQVTLRLRRPDEVLGFELGSDVDVALDIERSEAVRLANECGAFSWAVQP